MLYTTIESHTLDGRDRSLDDKIVFPKPSSPVFISTDIDYIVRNLGIHQRAISGYCRQVTTAEFVTELEAI